MLSDINNPENLDLTVRGDDARIELITFYSHYYLSQSYMSVNNMTNAIQELENANTKVPNKLWKNKVQWYLALAYLKKGRIKKAETLLKEVADYGQNNDYKQKANKLIDELNKK